MKNGITFIAQHCRDHCIFGGADKHFSHIYISFFQHCNRRNNRKNSVRLISLKYRFNFPNFDGVIFTPRSNPAAIGAIGDAQNRTRMARQRSKFCSRICIPDFDGLIPTPRSKRAAIGAKCDAINPSSIPSKRRKFCSRTCIPDSDGSILTP